MASLNDISGSKLKKISKEDNSVILEFVHPRRRKRYRVSFEGLLFETLHTPLNGVVESISVSHVLGFKALTELRKQRRNTDAYQQLYVKMRESTDDSKMELIGACAHLHIREYPNLSSALSPRQH